ncbi:MAG: nicotinate-nucleotide diphosphorylase (carboxylating), partial [Phycisphaerae bacterium]|nr:nicotinate-nucleotide diphosphorylase (carboxylating) [Phycisphaerae bacterium]NIX31074.1 nicotinate-nucleotide diphosphorylase (carboxylating) [Phycisphaerae bacterium]
MDKALANDTDVKKLVSQAFEEDVKNGDVTTNAIVDESQQARAVWIAKEEGIIAGLDVAKEVFQHLDGEIIWNAFTVDGESVNPADKLISIQGRARALLTAERIALNIAQRMSGIATMTHQFVDAV